MILPFQLAHMSWNYIQNTHDTTIIQHYMWRTVQNGAETSQTVQICGTHHAHLRVLGWGDHISTYEGGNVITRWPQLPFISGEGPLILGCTPTGHLDAELSRTCAVVRTYPLTRVIPYMWRILTIWCADSRTDAHTYDLWWILTHAPTYLLNAVFYPTMKFIITLLRRVDLSTYGNLPTHYHSDHLILLSTLGWLPQPPFDGLWLNKQMHNKRIEECHFDYAQRRFLILGANLLPILPINSSKM